MLQMGVHQRFGLERGKKNKHQPTNRSILVQQVGEFSP
jgi:hypothetical protein